MSTELERFIHKLHLRTFDKIMPHVKEKFPDATPEQVKDITFIAEQKLIDEFGGFIILSSEENNGMGLSLKPVIPGESGCGSCGGGCH